MESPRGRLLPFPRDNLELSRVVPPPYITAPGRCKLPGFGPPATIGRRSRGRRFLGKKSRSRRVQKTESPRPVSPSAPFPVSAAAERAALAAILAGAALFRLAYLLEYRAASVFYGRLMLDAQIYDAWAARLTAGAWFGGPVFYHAPLYPYLVAILYGLFGHRYLPVYLLQMALGLAVIYAVQRVGRRCSSPLAGLAAAAFLALYAPLPFFETKLMSTSVAVALSAGALVLLVEAWERGGAFRWLAAGATIGLAALAHPASLLLGPVFAAALLIRTRRLHEIAALAGGAILAVAPATLHNLAAGGGLVLVSSQGGITFLQGNSPKSRGLYRAVEGFSGNPLTQEEEEKSLAEKAVGHSLKASEISGYWFRKGLDTIRQSPVAALELMQLKLLRWFSSHEYSTEYSLSVEGEQVFVLNLLFVPFGFLAVGAAVGAVLGWRIYPRLAPVSLFVLGAAAPPLLFYVSSRYRIAAVPALAILAGVALERLAARARAGTILDALPAAGTFLFLGALTLVPYGRDHLFQEANVHYNLGNLLYDGGDYDRAIAEYRRAIAVSDLEFYRINLGNALTRKQRYDEAIDQYRQVLAKNPRFAKAHIQWAKTLLEQGRKEEALQQYRQAVALGLTSPDLDAKLRGADTSLGEDEIAAARKALAAEPGSASRHNNLGIALLKAGNSVEAEKEYRAACSLDPGYEKAHFNLGLLLEAQGRAGDALAEYQSAARINPSYVKANLKAGMLLWRQGDRARARTHFQEVLKFEPANSEALGMMKQLEAGR
jgi:tetratricopeptide (TPR) repeat protein